MFYVRVIVITDVLSFASFRSFVLVGVFFQYMNSRDHRSTPRLDIAQTLPLHTPIRECSREAQRFESLNVRALSPIRTNITTEARSPAHRFVAHVGIDMSSNNTVMTHKATLVCGKLTILFYQSCHLNSR